MCGSVIFFAREVHKELSWWNNGKDDFGVELGLKVLEEEVVPKVDDVSLVDGVFNGAFGGDGEEDFVMGEGVRDEAKRNEEDDCEDDEDGEGDDYLFWR
ncbi:hypothetical protein Tco_0551005 [Tanacetum coccineum]